MEKNMPRLIELKKKRFKEKRGCSKISDFLLKIFYKLVVAT